MSPARPAPDTQMKAFHFGSAGRRLFGCFHAAHPPVAAEGRSGPSQRAVLLVNPYGQEAVRTHRMTRVIAERLARAGIASMRFDAFGAGDSSGGDEQADLAGWSGDVLTASAELAERTAHLPQVWLGLRLGATAACLAAGRSGVPPQGLVLMEPIVDGAAYLQELAHATVRAFEASFSLEDRRWREELARAGSALEREAIGFALGESMRRQLLQLTPLALRAPGRSGVVLCGPPEAQSLSALATQWRLAGSDARWQPLPHRFDWTAEEASNTALVPHEIVQSLVHWACSPFGPSGPNTP